MFFFLSQKIVLKEVKREDGACRSFNEWKEMWVTIGIIWMRKKKTDVRLFAMIRFFFFLINM